MPPRKPPASAFAAPAVASPATAEAMAEHAGSAARLLKALANEHRLMVLCLLVETPLTVGEINERIGLSQSALSQHLAVLRNDGLVDAERIAQTVRYSLRAGPARHIIETLHGIYCTASAMTELRHRAATQRRDGMD